MRKRIFVILAAWTVCLGLCLSAGAAEETKPEVLKIYRVADSEERFDIAMIPINNPALAEVAVGADAVDCGLIGFALSIKNKTDRTYFLSFQNLAYTNCLGEVRRPMTALEAMRATQSSGTNRALKKIFLVNFSGDLETVVAGEADLDRFKRLGLLSQFHLPPQDELNGTIVFPFSDYIFFEKKESGYDDVSKNLTRVDLDYIPLKGSKLHLELVDIEGGRAAFDVDLDAPSQTVPLKTEKNRIKDKRKQSRQKTMMVEDLPEE